MCNMQLPCLDTLILFIPQVYDLHISPVYDSPSADSVPDGVPLVYSPWLVPIPVVTSYEYMGLNEPVISLSSWADQRVVVGGDTVNSHCNATVSPI